MNSGMIDLLESYFDRQDKFVLDWMEKQKRAGKVFRDGERKVFLTASMAGNENTPDGIVEALNEDAKTNLHNNREWSKKIVLAYMGIGLIESDGNQVYVMVPVIQADR